MAPLVQFLVGSLAIFGAATASAVKDLTPNNFDDLVLKSGKPALVEFFAPWCGHCKTLAPIYEELASTFESSSSKLTIAKVDADEHKSLGKRFGIQGFPTLKWFDGKSDTPQDYSSGRDLESLQSFITEKSGLRPKVAKKAPSAVQTMNDSSFRSAIGGDKNVLVAFTAPWCGHCKSLAPTWESLATTFSSEPSVTIAKVDAESPDSKAVASEQGVTGFPTIKYFPAGSTTAQPYEGGRTEAAFVEFLNKHAGTHRAVGGGLDSLAGTIPSLNQIVESVMETGNDWAGHAQQLKDAAVEAATGRSNAGSGRWSDYYVKVANKLAENKEYAEKELKRVEGIIKKGGLAPEKMDELTSRSNILRQFKAKVVGEKEEL